MCTIVLNFAVLETRELVVFFVTLFLFSRPPHPVPLATTTTSTNSTTTTLLVNLFLPHLRITLCTPKRFAVFLVLYQISNNTHTKFFFTTTRSIHFTITVFDYYYYYYYYCCCCCCCCYYNCY